MVYIAEEDRILFRVNSTDKKEYRFWLTRHYATLLAKVLKDHKKVDPDVSVQATPQAKAAVQEFKKEKAIGEATFGKKFEGDNNEYPLGHDIKLAFKLSYNHREDGTMQLSILPKEGQGINTTLTQLLSAAVNKGDWKLDGWITPPAPKS